MDSSYSPQRRNFYSTSRQASPDEVKSSIRDIQLEYAKALEKIDSLRLERNDLKAALNRALANNQIEQEKEYSSFMDRAAEDLKQCYTQKALNKAEQRILDLEEENMDLKKHLESQSAKVTRLQQDLLAYQDKVDQLGHIEVYNQHLQAEMQFLDQEFQTITKRVDELDDEKVKAQISKSISTKYSNDFNQTLLKYVNYITKTISGLETKHTVRSRFEELFPPNASILKLIGNRDYTKLMLKAFKYIAELLVNVSSEPVSPDFSPYSTGEMSNAKNGNFSAANSKAKDNVFADSSPLSLASPTQKLVRQGSASSKQSREAVTPTSLSNGLKSPQAASSVASTRKPSKESHGGNPRGSSMSFGDKNYKSRSIRSSLAMSPTAIKNVETPKSFKEPQSQGRDVESSSQMSRKEYNRNNSYHSHREEYDDKTAAEIELMQKHRELMDKERELMEKKRDLVSKAKELQEKEQFVQERRGQRQPEERDSNGVFIDLNVTPIHKKGRTEGSESNKNWVREEEPLSAKALGNNPRPILRGQNSQSGGEGERIDRRRDDSILSYNSNNSRIRNASKPLTRGNSSNEEIQRLEVKGEQEPYLQRTPTDCRSKERTPISSFKSLDYDPSKPKMRGSNRVSVSQSGNYADYDNDHIHDESPDGSMLSDKHREYNRNSKPSNKEYSLQKKVSFDDLGRRVIVDEHHEDEDENEQEYDVQHHHRSYSNIINKEEEEEDDEEDQYRSQRPLRRVGSEAPRGTQYPSFTVSFGRTESIEKRNLSPRVGDGSILDTPMKGRVDHMEQTYDVVRGQEIIKKAVRDRSPQYRMEVEHKAYGRPEINCAPEHVSRKSSKNC